MPPARRAFVAAPVIAAIGMPFVLAYMTAIYRTFRGKVRLADHGY